MVKAYNEKAKRGSPPRMRGKLSAPPHPVYQHRITPADAGKTYVKIIDDYFTQDHPRGCGENLSRRLYICKPAGSPPRMRGKLTNSRFIFKGNRITPADAGKTMYLINC